MAVWTQVASRNSVDQAVKEHRSAKAIATALDVHFLIRGNLTPAETGYNAELLVVDGPTERVLGTKSFRVATRAPSAREREDLEAVLASLSYKALQAEVQRARSKSDAALDVRDLSFRAFVDWNDKSKERDAKGAYVAATDLLDRALALAPDDPLAPYLTARVNLCDCVDGWSKNVEEQQAIGAVALEKYLRHDPDSASMLNVKSELFALRGRYEESLLITESVLKRYPNDGEALHDKAYALLKLGRPQDALASMNAAIEAGAQGNASLLASIHYTLGQYDLAARMARTALTRLSGEELRNHRLGTVALTLAAAEARSGHVAQAKAALADFNAAVPSVRTVPQVKAWMHPAADLAGYEPLFDGLRLAGVAD